MSKQMISKVYIFAVLLAFFSLAISLHLPISIAALLFLFAIVTIGIPHGALDFYLAQSLKNKPSITWKVAFFSIYSLITMLSIVVWLSMPTLGLAVFLLISVYHFSTDWAADLPTNMAITVALILLCAPALLYQSTIIETFTMLLLTPGHASIITLVMQSVAAACFVFLLLKISPLYACLGSNRWQMIELVGLLLSAILLPPLLHFVLYFCLLHSIKHWSLVSIKLKLSFTKMVLVSAPIVVVTIITGVIVWKVVPNDGHYVDIVRLVFIGLFGLTVAHMLLVEKWQRQVYLRKQA